MTNTYTLLYSQNKKVVILLMFCFTFFSSFGQEAKSATFFTKADSLNKTRLVSSASFSAATYSAFTYGLYNTWYKKYDQEPFHLFNDLDEWRYMDKVGHFYTAYFQGVLCYKGAQWTGLNKKKSILTGMVLGSLFQSTIEIMDGYSTKWGFSIPDVAFNFAGSSVFALQQGIWDDQRISFKISNIPKPYDSSPILSIDGLQSSSLHSRASSLYGSSFAEKFLKDYNTQVYWASINIESFLPGDSKVPNWLNVAIGYGAGNMFGGFANEWSENGSQFILTGNQNRRYSSFFIAPDIDFWHLRTKYSSVNTILDIINIFKIPMPAIEINTLGEFHFHFFI